MSNINLNVGVGGVGCGIVAAVVVFQLADATDSGGMYRLVPMAVIGGALVGNFLWGLVFRKAE
jgi:hypothetical protein